jgi:hypothetical protein
MLHLCTLFDQRYLVYGLALYQSLVRWAGRPFTLHVLCLDDAVLDYLQRASLPYVRLIKVSDLEDAYPLLSRARENRSLVEYYFTLVPALPLYLFEHTPDVELVTYVDADLYCYSTLDPIYQVLGDGSILLIPHGEAAPKRGGIYNVGVIVFRNDQSGRSCLSSWHRLCIEWCYDRWENGKYADQGYLDPWPVMFSGVVVSRHRGIGLAPWNVGGCALSFRDDRVYVDGDPLVFYHFADLRMVHPSRFTCYLVFYGGRLTKSLKQLVYKPYVCELRAIALSAQIVSAWSPRWDQVGSLKDRIRLALMRARLVVVASRVLFLHWGQLGPIIVRMRKRLFPKPDDNSCNLHMDGDYS